MSHIPAHVWFSFSLSFRFLPACTARSHPHSTSSDRKLTPHHALTNARSINYYTQPHHQFWLESESELIFPPLQAKPHLFYILCSQLLTMGLTKSAIIVIVLVGCLAITAMGAALFRRHNPLEETARPHDASHEQHQYMRQVRMINYGHLKRESLGGAKDLESRCTLPDQVGWSMPLTNTDTSEEALAYHQPYAHDSRSPSTNLT